MSKFVFDPPLPLAGNVAVRTLDDAAALKSARRHIEQIAVSARSTVAARDEN
jgi:hypothetical protein